MRTWLCTMKINSRGPAYCMASWDCQFARLCFRQPLIGRMTDTPGHCLPAAAGSVPRRLQLFCCSGVPCCGVAAVPAEQNPRLTCLTCAGPAGPTGTGLAATTFPSLPLAPELLPAHGAGPQPSSAEQKADGRSLVLEEGCSCGKGLPVHHHPSCSRLSLIHLEQGCLAYHAAGNVRCRDAC